MTKPPHPSDNDKGYRNMITPDRAIVINHATHAGFTVTLDPPGPASTIDAVLDTHLGAVQYAEGAAAMLRCPVIYCTDLAAFDGVAAIISDLQAYLPTIDDIRAMSPPVSVGPSVPVPVAFVHVLIGEVLALRESVTRLETALLMASPAGAA